MPPSNQPVCGLTSIVKRSQFYLIETLSIESTDRPTICTMTIAIMVVGSRCDVSVTEDLLLCYVSRTMFSDR